MEIRVIYPEIDEDLNIICFRDAEYNEYKDFNELFDDIESGTYIFFFYYNLVYENFERWTSHKGIDSKFGKSRIYYTGKPKEDFIAPIIKVSSANSDPDIGKVRGSYKGKTFYMYDIKKFIRGITDFNISDDDIMRSQEYMYFFNKEIVASCNFGFPNSLASASRHILPNPFLLDKRNMSEMFLTTTSSRVGGLYYLKETDKTYDVLYDYDIRSLYPYLLVEKLYPDLKEQPIPIRGFEPVEKDKELALYHITDIRLSRKPNGIPSLWTQKEMREKMNRYGLVNNDIIECYNIDSIEGWITSIDYEIIKKFYNVKTLVIDKSIIYPTLVKGSKYFGPLKKYYYRKEKSKGLIRTLYKVIIDSYSGSLAMGTGISRRKQSLDDEGFDIFLPSDENEPPKDIYGFMTAYGRLFIATLAEKADLKNVVSIDTDGIFATDRTLDAYCGEGLGSLRLDKIMYNAKWFGQKQYEYQDELGNWIPTIAGLPSYLYEHGKVDYEIPKIIFNRKTASYVKKYTKFNLKR